MERAFKAKYCPINPQGWLLSLSTVPWKTLMGPLPLPRPPAAWGVSNLRWVSLLFLRASHSPPSCFSPVGEYSRHSSKCSAFLTTPCFLYQILHSLSLALIKLGFVLFSFFLSLIVASYFWLIWFYFLKFHQVSEKEESMILFSSATTLAGGPQCNGL